MVGRCTGRNFVQRVLGAGAREKQIREFSTAPGSLLTAGLSAGDAQVAEVSPEPLFAQDFCSLGDQCHTG